MKAARRRMTVVASVILGATAVLALWLPGKWRDRPANFSGKSADEIAEYFRSDEFKNLDPNTRRASAREAMGEMMTGRVREYFELPVEQRTAYLDKIIDSRESRQRGFGFGRRGFAGPRGSREFRRGEPSGQRAPEPRRLDGSRGSGRRRPDRIGAPDRPRRGPGQGGRRGRRRSPERMRARMERHDPVTRAQMAKFREALRERMRERGIEPRGPRR